MAMDPSEVEQGRIQSILEKADPFMLMFEMATSDKTDKLDKAFIQAKKEIGTLVREEGNNPHFKSKFATLKECWIAIHKPLVANGLTFQQWPTGNFLVNWLKHESGQYMVSKYRMAIDKGGPQAQGSSISYAKRYSLCGIFGLTGGEPDDDGEMAEGRGADNRGSNPLNKPKQTKKSSFQVNEEIPF